MEALLQQARSVDPQSPEPLQALASLRYEQGASEEALQLLRQSMVLWFKPQGSGEESDSEDGGGGGAAEAMEEAGGEVRATAAAAAVARPTEVLLRAWSERTTDVRGCCCWYRPATSLQPTAHCCCPWLRPMMPVSPSCPACCLNPPCPACCLTPPLSG